MKDIQKQARLKIAADGLLYMEVESFKGYSPSPKDIFYPKKNYSNIEVAEVHKNKWQTELLKRLVSYNLLRKHTKNRGSQEGYTILNLTLFKSITDDYYNNSGELLSGLLWPGRATKKASELMAIAMMTDKEKISVVKKELSVVKKEEIEINEDDEKDFVDNATLSDLAANIFNFGKLLEALINLSSDSFNRIESKSAELGEFSKKLGGFNKRLDSVDNHVNQLNSSINKSCSMVKELSDQASSLSKQALNFSDLIASLDETKKSDEKLRSNMSKLITSVEESKKDQLGNVLTKLSSHITDGETLKEMLLEELSNG